MSWTVLPAAVGTTVKVCLQCAPRQRAQNNMHRFSFSAGFLHCGLAFTEVHFGKPSPAVRVCTALRLSSLSVHCPGRCLELTQGIWTGTSRDWKRTATNTPSPNPNLPTPTNFPQLKEPTYSIVWHFMCSRHCVQKAVSSALLRMGCTVFSSSADNGHGIKKLAKAVA